MTMHRIRCALVAALTTGLLSGAGGQAPRGSSKAPPLRFEQVGADTTAFAAVATLIIGPKHALLWDAQYHKADAERVVEAIVKSGKSLQAIIISHPDEDHYTGLGTIIARFPGTPVYITRAGLAVFDSMAPPRFRSDRARSPALFPDTLIRPSVLPSNHFTLDGVAVEVIPDLQGDVLTPTNSALWVPSQRTLLTGDIVFRDVYPWFGASDSTSRVAWRASIRRLAALRPTVVIAGHKPRLDLPDTPAVLDSMDRYLATFDSIRLGSSSAPMLRDAMLARYPTYAVRMLLAASAGTAFRGKAAPPASTAPASGTAGPSGGTIPPGTWTGTVEAGGGPINAEFGFGNREGKLTLELRPDGPPPAETSEVRFDGATLTFSFAIGERRLYCKLTGTVARGLEGTCGPVAGEPGPVQMKMVPPKP